MRPQTERTERDSSPRSTGTAGATLGQVEDGPRVWLRLEGLTVLLLATAAYRLYTPGSWLLFAALFLVPDVSMLGYARGPRGGALLYNSIHNYVAVTILGVVGALWLGSTVVAVSLVWAAHIGFDRCLGYGLKYPSAFQHTHLGRIGRSPAPG